MTDTSRWYLRFRSARTWSQLASILVIVIGGLVLVGWVFDITELKSILPGLATMKVNTAIAFVLAGIALWLWNGDHLEKRGRILAEICSLAVLLIGLLTLSEYIFGWDLGIDRYLLRATDLEVGTLFPGRMTEVTAVGFFTMGLALWFLRSPKRDWIAQSLAGIITGITLLILTGYLYGVDSLSGILAFGSVAPHTTLVLLVASIGILLARPDQGLVGAITSTKPGGLMARRLLPAVILFPLIIGWLRLQGQKHGLYTTEFGLALFALSNVVTFAVFVLWNAYLLNRIDTERQRVDAALERSEKRFQAIIENSTDGISLLGPDGSVLYENATFARLLGITSLGKNKHTVFGLVHPDDQVRARELFRQVVKTPGSSIPVLVRAQDQNGSWHWLEGNFSNMLSESGVEAVVARYREVTQRVEAEKARQASEERFRTVVESALNGILIVSPNGQIVQANEQSEKLFGYPPGELAGMSVETLIPERFRAGHLTYREGYLLNPDTRFMGVGRELAGRRKDGTEFPVEIGLSYTKTDQGVLTVAYITDISERKRAQEAVEKERALLSLVINHLPDYVYVKDTQSRFILSNSSHLQLMGCTSLDQVVGKTDFDLFPHHLAAQYYADEQEVIRSGQPMMDHEESTMSHSGQQRWVITTKLPLRDTKGQIIGIVGITRDITERKQSEQQIIDSLARESAARAEVETSNQRLAFLLEANTLLAQSTDYRSRLEQLTHLTVPQIADWCAIEILKEDGKLERLAVAHINPNKVEHAFEIQRRFPPDPNVERGAYRVLRTGEPELYSEIPDTMLTATAQSEEHLNMIREIGLKSAMVIPLVAHDHALGAITLVISESDKRFGPDDLALAGDLARRAAMQIENAHLYDEARRLNIELEQRVVERTAQLESSNKELEAFSYSISHDLRAPLRAITGFSNILVNEYEATLPAEANRYLQRISQNTQRMGQLIDDLLALSRLGRQTLRKQPTQPGVLVRQVLEELNVTQEYPDATIVVGDMPICQADPTLLKQVFVNLISNALKFTAQREKIRIEVDSLQVEGQTTFFVKDNGVGFDMQYANKLFGVFQRLHSVQEYPGTGVGLAIVHRIVGRHGGRVWAEAEVDQGATFFFTLGDDQS